jgi:hypothetical protein
MIDLTLKKIAIGCPWRVEMRGEWHCKPLIGQPNGSLCNVESNCACIYMAELIANETMARVVKMMKGGEEIEEAHKR